MVKQEVEQDYLIKTAETLQAVTDRSNCLVEIIHIENSPY